MTSMRGAFAFFFAASALLSGCLFIPRIELPYTPDPHNYSSVVSREDGSVYRFGDVREKARRPYVERASADGKVLWRWSFGVLGNGGHGTFTAGAPLPDGGALVAGAEQTQTTVAVLRFDANGKVLWGNEIELPSQAADQAKIVPTEDGAVLLVPLGGEKGPSRLHVIRIALDGSATWATTVGIVGRPVQTVWSKERGLTYLGPRFAADLGLSFQERSYVEGNIRIVARVAPDGELAWMRELRTDGEWVMPELASTPDGDVVIAVGKLCARCGTNDVEMARLDDGGGVRWAIDVHRPAPPVTEADIGDDQRPNHLPPLPHALTAAPDGSLALVTAFPGASRDKTALDVMRLGADGQVLDQRGFAIQADRIDELTARGGDVVVKPYYKPKCTVPRRPAPANGCADEVNVALRTTSATVDPVKLQPLVARSSPTSHDLGPEIARTRRSDL